MQNALSTTVEFLMAERLIGAVISEESITKDTASLDRQLSRMFGAVFARSTESGSPVFSRSLQRT
jgi:hypothetical protein